MSPAPIKHVEEHFLRIAPPEGASQACPRKATVDRLASAEGRFFVLVVRMKLKYHAKAMVLTAKETWGTYDGQA